LYNVDKADNVQSRTPELIKIKNLIEREWERKREKRDKM